MATVLYIKANPKPDNLSYTFKMSEAFIAAYKEKNPGDEIITLDLYQEDLRFLNGEMLEQMFSGKPTVRFYGGTGNKHYHHRINRGFAGRSFGEVGQHLCFRGQGESKKVLA